MSILYALCLISIWIAFLYLVAGPVRHIADNCQRVRRGLKRTHDTWRDLA